MEKNIDQNALLIRSLALLAAIGSSLFCQLQDVRSVDGRDSVISIVRPSVPEFLRLQPSRFSMFSLDVVSAAPPGSLNRWGMYSPEFFDVASPKKIDLTAPWKLHLMRQEENRTLYSILGSVNVGGTAYLLYRHLKKNGLK